MAILDKNGRPFAIDRPLMEHFENFQAMSFKLAPFNPEQLINREGIHKLDDQLKHAAIRAPLSIIRDAVLFKGVRVQPFNPDTSQPPPPEAVEIADALSYVLDHMEDEYGNPQDPRSVVWELLYAIHVGYQVTEVIPKLIRGGKYKGKIGVSQFACKPARQIGFDVDERTMAVRHITSYTPSGGYQMDIPVTRCLRYTHEPQGGLPHGKAIGVTVFKHAWSLDFLVKFWNLALELYGVPFLVATAPQGAAKEVFKVLKEIRQGAPPVLPQGATFELVEAVVQNFDVALEWHEKQCSLAYLLSTLTSDEGKHGSTSAGADAHADTREYGLAARRWDMEGVLNRQFVRRWVRWNYGEDALDYAPKITLGDWDEADAEKWSNAVDKLVKNEVAHPDEPALRDRIKLPPMPPELRDDMKAKREQKQKLEEQKALRPTTPPTSGKEN